MAMVWTTVTKIDVASAHIDEAGNGHMHKRRIAWTMQQEWGGFEIVFHKSFRTGEAMLTSRLGSSSYRRDDI